ncbi:sugar-transfer associated ATP-grasp domain-containing protein [Sphingomonas sp.]|jgi:hypothetical protein|uniref:sugar-transfer associated ATP-grasp domain-containing protein n=1 Tax=Sphingomonas sp. TaxID=28214 RepID=UPI002E0E014F|nr:sugar-transfer associated ATP-grasp domain-containing protein [Sphingomonas sp.]
MIKRYWRELPWDGEGWARPDDPALADLRRWAAAQWRSKHAPIPSGIIWLASRLLWPLAVAGQVAGLARRLPTLARWTVYADCVRTGASPLEAHVWRSLHATPHPLPAKASALLISRLGAGEDQRLLTDKLAAAAALSAVGPVFPKLVQLIRSEEPIALAAELCAGTALFAKPRHGHGGRGGFALDYVESEWRMDGRPVSEPDLLARIARSVRHDDLLIQERVRAHPALENLSQGGRAPVLRLVTAQYPGAQPFLHSALMAIGVPGQNPANFLEGTVFAPVDSATGTMAQGLLLARPRDRLRVLPWNGVALENRKVADFNEAVRAALSAMTALPGLPVVHWDVIVSSDGPVMLEGNVGGNWILASLPERAGLAVCDLAHVLSAWKPACANARPLHLVARAALARFF